MTEGQITQKLFEALRKANSDLGNDPEYKDKSWHDRMVRLSYMWFPQYDHAIAELENKIIALEARLKKLEAKG